jgi:hypothetical protein
MLDSLFERRRRGWRRRTREIARHATRTRDANTRASFEAASVDGDGRRARRSAVRVARRRTRVGGRRAARTVPRGGEAMRDATREMY